jgi:AraC-like DNA-binding protein
MSLKEVNCSMHDAVPNIVTRQGPRRHATNEATLHIASISQIPEVLRDLGADPAQVCAAAGFDYTLFNDPASLITYREASHLFRVCTESTGCPHFGLLLGQKSGLDGMGLIGLLAKYSPEVRTALQTLVRFMHLHIRGAVKSFEESGNEAILSYAIHAPNAEATDQMADASLGTLSNVMVALCGPRWKPIEVWFEHRRPFDAAPFRRFFQAPLRFDMHQNALVFAASWLNQPLPAAEPEVSRLLREKVATLEARHQHQFPDQVRSILRTSLVNDRGSADQVAELLSMHSRTLHRRLASAGTNFRTLVEECRYEIARQMLETSNSDVGHISDLLDYASAGAFTRAFRRWSGTTPSQWRTRDQAVRRPIEARMRSA